MERISRLPDWDMHREPNPEAGVARPNKRTRRSRQSAHVPVQLLGFALTESHGKVTIAEGARRNLSRVRRDSKRATSQGRVRDLDEQLKHLMKELGNAINESLSESERIAEVIGSIKQSGYDVFLVLEATIGFNRREESIKKEPKKSGTNTTDRLRFTNQDAKFLKALKITVDEDMH